MTPDTTGKPQKRSGYLQDVDKEAADIIYQAQDKNDAVAKIRDLINAKVLESFKNGIQVGMKKAGKVK